MRFLLLVFCCWCLGVGGVVLGVVLLVLAYCWVGCWAVG